MVRESSESGSRPRFSIVTAVYNVARYLDEFIASVDGQTFDPARIEIVAVDDGSTDESLELLRAWEQRRPGVVRVVTKENGGQATARNLGLELASGEWVTFTDPDDIIEPDYLAEVDSFLSKHPETEMVGTNRLLLDDTTKELTEHPLSFHFQTGNRLRDLNAFPDHFFGSAPCAFFRLESVRERGLTFDGRIRPNFEDGHFCCHYLLRADKPLVGFVTSARYHYRKRQDSSSTLQGSLNDPRRYTDVLRFGYLDVLEASLTSTGTSEEWVQSFVLYELSWLFSSWEASKVPITVLVGDVAAEHHDLMAQITGLISTGVIEGFSIRTLKRAWREILVHGYQSDPWNTPFAILDRLDTDQGLVRLSYRFTGELPDEQFMVRGEVVPPMHSKVRDLEYHGRTLLRERIVWLSSRTSLRARVNGSDLELRFSAPPLPVYTLRPQRIRDRLGRSRSRPVKKRTPAKESPLLRDRLTEWLSRSRLVRRRFGRSWVLMDRIHDADDSGERLFRYLRDERPDINAWFTLEAGTADWKKLRADGYRHLVPHGSLRWKLLMANCSHLISSHADMPVIRPPAITAFTKPRWRFTFLQHGVIKDDLSSWLGPKSIDIFVTSTEPEYASIAGDNTTYPFTTKEVKLTGLPRFDRLLEKGQAIAPDDRDLLLVTPTWREWLVPPLEVGSQRRTVRQDFLQTDYAENWLGFLSSPELAALAQDKGLTIGFLPHPNIQPILPSLDLPDHVQALNFSDFDVQELFARAAVLVTDYSSVAFNSAYIERPVVYFQFDAEQTLNGAHVGRKGYFDYGRDGFGPVASDLEDAVEQVVQTVKHGPHPSDVYLDRIQATFPRRDGRCCERVVAEIEASTGRVLLSEATNPVPTPGTRS